MLKFQEAAKYVTIARFNSACSDAMIARRYIIQRKLGNGSFGSVYLVSDRKAKQGEELKVLKEISVGDLKPNETVEANLEAQLLSKLDHPAIVKFYASFVERDSFCIITEYCEGGDLDFKIQEYKESGKIFSQKQIIDWFIQLLLGVNYMHERWILHRDLKAKNIFLKNNLLKIGDFGVSCLLMGSCDLATTFTGTPYYMSPEALKHQGYNTKSDIWSLGCILYEMCCMSHAFTGHNFLSVVLKIVEGDTPSLPDRYPRKLNAVLCSMLNKNPLLRPAAAEILKIPYIDEQLKHIQYKFTNMTVKDKALNRQKEAAPIFDAVQRKVHLQTLQELSEVQKMTPRERMRLRKLNAADEKARKLKQLAEEKYQENIKRMQEFRSRNFQQLSVDILHESDEQTSNLQIHSQPVSTSDCVSIGHDKPSGNEASSQLYMSEPTDHEIPEDPEIAEEYYNDEFESYSEGSEEEEDAKALQTISKTNHQDSDIEAMVKHLESVLNNSSLDLPLGSWEQRYLRLCTAI
ncbi:serine/threonine-protein kinase Nek11 isoform X4 [Apus apus]|uniref:serine/threonine-protein kinase Nek11 isoform X4 n=1 Tax=Apus apus TaxID=8895 RepID=UPI0021F819D8|nr:serine/threonine-protein kinase Nek11 isoform X4 [Apus apus]